MQTDTPTNETASPAAQAESSQPARPPRKRRRATGSGRQQPFSGRTGIYAFATIGGSQLFFRFTNEYTISFLIVGAPNPLILAEAFMWDSEFARYKSGSPKNPIALSQAAEAFFDGQPPAGLMWDADGHIGFGDDVDVIGTAVRIAGLRTTFRHLDEASVRGAHERATVRKLVQEDPTWIADTSGQQWVSTLLSKLKA